MAVDLMQWLAEAFANDEGAREPDPKVRLDAFIEFARKRIREARFTNFQQVAGNLKMTPTLSGAISDVWLCPQGEVKQAAAPFVHVFDGGSLVPTDPPKPGGVQVF